MNTAMSLHNKHLTDLESDGLTKYGLPIDKPSQLSDAFRLGMAWALQALNEKSQAKLTERELMVEEMRENGKTYKEIAKKLDITLTRVRQLIVAGERKREKQNPEKHTA